MISPLPTYFLRMSPRQKKRSAISLFKPRGESVNGEIANQRQLHSTPLTHPLHTSKGEETNLNEKRKKQTEFYRKPGIRKKRRK